MKKQHYLIFILCIAFLSSANLFGQSSSAKTYFCPPCHSNCDLIAFEQPGNCTHCNMELVQRTATAQKKLLKQLSEVKNIKVAVYIQNGAEILDLAGPIEVFSYAGMNVFTVGVDNQPIKSQGVLTIIPEYTIENCPSADIVVFVGGNGANAASNPKVQQWIKKIAPDTPQFFSVCTGAFFLAEAGLLKGQTATTFYTAIESLRKKATGAIVLEDVRYVDNGKIITTAGISAGIDGALHLVHRMLGKEMADNVARYMEYDYWKPGRGLVVEK